MSTKLEQYRQKNPKYANMSDDELANYLHTKSYSDMPFEQFAAAIGYKPPRSAGKEFVKGVSSGIDSLQATGYGLAALAGDAAGSDGVKEWGLRGYMRNTEEAGKNGPSVSSYKDVDSVGDAIDYAAGGLGQLVPFAAGSLGSGGVGAIIGRKLAEKGAAKLVESELRGAVGGEVAKRVAADVVAKGASRGAMGGALANSYGVEAGSIYGDTFEKTGQTDVGTALAYAAPAAALDTLGEASRIGKILGVGGKGAKEAGQSFKKQLAREVGKEAATEAAQTYIERKAVEHVDPTQLATSPEGMDEIINAGIIGGLGGAAGGAGAHLMDRRRPADAAAVPGADNPLAGITGTGQAAAQPGAADPADPAAGATAQFDALRAKQDFIRNLTNQRGWMMSVPDADREHIVGAVNMARASDPRIRPDIQRKAVEDVYNYFTGMDSVDPVAPAPAPEQAGMPAVAQQGRFGMAPVMPGLQAVAPQPNVFEGEITGREKQPIAGELGYTPPTQALPSSPQAAGALPSPADQTGTIRVATDGTAAPETRMQAQATAEQGRQGAIVQGYSAGQLGNTSKGKDGRGLNPLQINPAVEKLMEHGLAAEEAHGAVQSIKQEAVEMLQQGAAPESVKQHIEQRAKALAGATQKAAAVQNQAPAQEQKQTDAAGQADAVAPLRIEPLSDKAIILKGDTKTHVDRIRALKQELGVGGWNKSHQGWVFPASRRAQVEGAMGELLNAPEPAKAPEQAKAAEADQAQADYDKADSRAQRRNDLANKQEDAKRRQGALDDAIERSRADLADLIGKREQAKSNGNEWVYDDKIKLAHARLNSYLKANGQQEEPAPEMTAKPVEQSTKTVDKSADKSGESKQDKAQAEAPKKQAKAESTAPEHAQVGVDDRELAQIVDEFNQAQSAMLEDGERVSHVFDAPAKGEVVRLNDKAKVYVSGHGWMSPEEAKQRIAEWKAHAAAQGKDQKARNANGQKVVLSLFDKSGAWSQPWEDAGYQVFRFDIQNDPDVGDVNNFSTGFFNDWFGDFEGADIYAVLAACPCTDFASSGARHFAAKDADGRTVASVNLVHQTLRTIEHFKPAVWAVENPVGRIEQLGGLPPWRLSFDPNHLGDPYTKKTLIWGRFNGDLPVAPVEPTEGSKMHRMYGGKSLATKNARSVTPEGFAYGFFMANNAIDNPVMAVANKFDRLDRGLIEQAIGAGLTEGDIEQAVEDHYYMDLNDAAAEQALREAIDEATQGDSQADNGASPLVQAMNDLADVRARIEAQGRIVDDRLLSRERQLKALVKELQGDQYGAQEQKGPYAKWRDSTPAERRELLRQAGYTDADQARTLSGTEWGELTDPVRNALSAAPGKLTPESERSNKQSLQEQKGETNGRARSAANGAGALEGKPAANVRPAAEVGATDAAGEGGSTGRAKPTGNTDGAGADVQRSVGNREGGNHSAAGEGRGSKQRGDGISGDIRNNAPASESLSEHGRRVSELPPDYQITDSLALGDGGQKAKYKGNVAAIRLLDQLRQEGRTATAEEQDVLARYVGWGGIPQAFDATNEAWAKEHAELKSLLSPDEFEAARESTRYAHYTSREIIGGIYDALKHIGFTGGQIMEPGCGVGNFIGLMPAEIRTGTRFTGVERERIASSIAKALYPHQNIQSADFREFNAADGHFDAVIGNPPFASTSLTDLSGRKHLTGLSVHNYFFAKSLDMTREGGIMAMVVSNSFMDAKRDTARAYIGHRAKLLGAIRLPNNAFSKNANTEVTTDIVFLQKLSDADAGSMAAKADFRRWADLTTVTDKATGKEIPINRYFADNPHMMLGEMTLAGTMYRPDSPALVAREGQDTAALLAQAVKALPGNVYEQAAARAGADMEAAKLHAFEGLDVQEGGHFVRDGKLYQRVRDMAGEQRAVEVTPDTRASEKTLLGEKKHARLVQLTTMRETMRKLIAAEIKGDKAMSALRKSLNEQYDAYTKANGHINSRANIQLFGDDPDFPLLAALEYDYDPGVSRDAAKRQGVDYVAPSAKKAPILSQRVIQEAKPVDRADDAGTAVGLSLAELGRVDIGHVAKLLGKSQEAVIEELTQGDKPYLYQDPATGGYVTRDEYLSGNVRQKHEEASRAGMIDNARALDKVMPEDVPAHEIYGRLGSPWIPPSVYEDFAKHLLGDGTTAKVIYVKANSSFVLTVKPGSEAANFGTYGTKDKSAVELLTALMNKGEIKVGHYVEEGKSRRFVLDKEKTDEANDKARVIRDKFSDWLFTDPERSEMLVRKYNDANNNYVTRVFDGSLLTFPGKVPDSIIKFRRHQRDAIARMVQQGKALLDHVVGAGKTFTVIGGVMELKRTGLASKPMIAVPNHLVKQWASDFYRLYPGANILTATKKDFERANRRAFLAKIATGNWDAVIIAHSSFGFIRPEPEFEQAFVAKQVSQIVDAIQAIKEESGSSMESKRTVKQLEGIKEGLENRIARLRDKPMDNLLDFGQLGVDFLAVDEAHMFKNLMFITKSKASGLGDPEGSQRAFDMYIKTQYLQQKHGGRGVTFATGTPVSNSLAEKYHIMRYLAPNTLTEMGHETFDAWADTFAEEETVWMQALSGEGYKAKQRLSRFVNTPELLKLYDQFADTVTIEDIKEAYREENNGKEFPIPPLHGGKRQPVSIPRSEAQTEYMGEIGARAKELEQRKGKPEKGADNMLSIMGDARKAAMDIRLVRPDITERDPNGRIAEAARQVAARYRQYDDVRGTQLVFSDMGTPKKHAAAELKIYNELAAIAAKSDDAGVQADAAVGNEAALKVIEEADEARAKIESFGKDWMDAVKSAMRGFSVYDDMRAALIEQGIPENEIAFIHDYNTDEQKASLFRAVNQGKIRVLLGSTPKMGAGTNVQERLVALHHLDVPWKPSDVEQREGRIIRQGNALLQQIPGFEVEVLAYATQDTLDLFMWQTQEQKLKMIGQLRSREIGREVDNAFEEMQMSAGEMQAAATSNPHLMREIQLKDKIKKLERKKRSFESQRNDIARQLKGAKLAVEVLPARIERELPLQKAAIDYAGSLSRRFDSFKATIEGETFTDPAAAREKIKELTEGEVAPGERRKTDVTMNGERYTSKAKLDDAFWDLVGDASPLLLEINGKTFNRRSKAAAEIKYSIVDAAEGESTIEVGKLGDMTVEATGVKASSGDYRFVVVVKHGDAEAETSVGGIGYPGLLEVREHAPGAIIEAARTLARDAQFGVETLKDTLERNKRFIADIEKEGLGVGEWDGVAELNQARADYERTLKDIEAFGKAEPAPEGQAQEAAGGDNGDAGQPGPQKYRMAPNRIEHPVTKAIVDAMVDGLRKQWGNMPDTVVAAKVSDLPEEFRAQMEKDGATNAQGFINGGKVYLIAENIPNIREAMMTIAHEILGHYGLRGIAGNKLNLLMRDIYNKHADIREQADKFAAQNGVSLEEATEEVLAELAALRQLQQHGVWQKIVAAVRRVLRSIGLVQEWSDADIEALLANARRYVTENPTGGPGGGGRKGSMYSRGVQSLLGRVFDSVASFSDNWRTKTSQEADPAKLAAEMTGGEFAAERDGNTIKIGRMVDDGMGEWLQAHATIHDIGTKNPYIVIIGERATGGALAYQIAMAWAHNNGKHLIPDPRGITPVNRLRRTEAMIASMLRYQTSVHLEPHPDQFVGLLDSADYAKLNELKRPIGTNEAGLDKKLAGMVASMWRNETPDMSQDQRRHAYEHNLDVMLRASVALAQRRLPALKDLYYDQSGKLFDGITGQTVNIATLGADADIDVDAVAPTTGIGYATLRRAVLGQTILSAQHLPPTDVPGVSGDQSAQQTDSQRLLENRRAWRAATPEAINRFAEGLARDGRILYRRADAADFLSDGWRDQFTQSARDWMQKTSPFNSWWHKTVGTQYHKATVDKDFGRVFGWGQQFINDVARLAMDAESMAPNLLVKLGSLSDLKNNLKFAISKRHREDLRTVSAAIFQGTVHEWSGKDGLATGVVWNEAQLRDRFKMNERQIGMYREARAAIDRSLDDYAKSIIYRLAQGEPIPQRMVDGIRTSSSGAKVVAGAMRVELLRAAEAARAAGKESEVNRLLKVGEMMKDAAAKVEALKAAGYAPLMRFGSHTVYVTDGSEQVYFGMFDSKVEAAQMARKMREAYPSAKVEQGTLNDEAHKLFKGLSPDTIELFAEHLGLEKDPAMQEYYKLAVASRSAMKRMIHRKMIDGYSEDVTRVLANFITSNARSGSSNYNLGNLRAAVDAIPKAKGDVQKEAVRLMEYLQEPREEAPLLRGLMFAHFMGGSVAAALVNMTQPIMQTAPYLYQFASLKRVSQALKDAAMDQDGKRGDSVLQQAIVAAEAEGVLAPHEIHQLMAEGGIGFMDRSYSLRALKTAWGGFFSLAESFNRRITFIAAFQIAREMGAKALRDKGYTSPFAFATQAVYDTQGIYNKGNRPNWARGAVGATLFTFKQFSISYLEFMKRLYGNGRKPEPAFLLAIGLLALAAGAEGLPFAEDIEDLIDTLGQWAGYNTNTKRSLRETAHEWLGKEVGGFVLHGASTQMPLDFAGRLSVGNLIPGTGAFKAGSKGADFLEFFGASAGFAQSIGKMTEHLAKGEPGEALRQGGPKAIRDIMQAGYMIADGYYSDSKGRKKVDTDSLDAALKAIGFQPQSVASESRIMTEIMQDKSTYSAARADIVQSWANGLAHGNPALVKQAREALAEWNRKNPETPIVIRMQDIARKVKEMRTSGRERLVKGLPKSMRSDAQKAFATLDDDV